MAVTESNLRVEPVDAFYGDRNKDTITTIADSTDSLDGTYWTFYSLASDGTETGYFVWYNTSGGAAVSPAPAGLTEIEVAITTDDTAAAVASATNTALSAVTGFSNKVSGAVLTIESGYMGAVTAPVTDVDAGFTEAVVTTGAKFDLGGHEDIDLSFTIDKTDLLASQLGTTLLDQVNTGTNVSVTIPVLEVTPTLWQKLVGSTFGGTETVGANSIHGIGESKRFSNLKQYASELMLIPSNASDDTRNIHIWSAMPDLTGLNFSGSDMQKMDLEFSAYRDSDRPETVSVAGLGVTSDGMLK
jgi:hypothetical protein